NQKILIPISPQANIMKLADGLFLKICTDIAKEYPDIEYNNMIIDNCSMQVCVWTLILIFFEKLTDPLPPPNSSSQIQTSSMFCSCPICTETFSPTSLVAWSVVLVSPRAETTVCT